MMLKRLVMVAALVFMIPAGLAFAMSGFESGSPVELKAYYVKEDPFLGWYGWWGEKAASRGRISVTQGENGWYGFEISWRRNASQTDMWMLTAKPISKDTMQYKDCQHYLLTFNATNRNVIDREETIHLNGTGTITVNRANEMIWHDDQDRRAADCVFVKLNLPDGGGL